MILKSISAYRMEYKSAFGLKHDSDSPNACTLMQVQYLRSTGVVTKIYTHVGCITDHAKPQSRYAVA